MCHLYQTVFVGPLLLGRFVTTNLPSHLQNLCICDFSPVGSLQKAEQIYDQPLVEMQVKLCNMAGYFYQA